MNEIANQEALVEKLEELKPEDGRDPDLMAPVRDVEEIGTVIGENNHPQTKDMETNFSKDEKSPSEVQQVNLEEDLIQETLKTIKSEQEEAINLIEMKIDNKLSMSRLFNKETIDDVKWSSEVEGQNQLEELERLLDELSGSVDLGVEKQFRRIIAKLKTVGKTLELGDIAVEKELQESDDLEANSLGSRIEKFLERTRDRISVSHKVDDLISTKRMERIEKSIQKEVNGQKNQSQYFQKRNATKDLEIMPRTNERKSK